MDEKTLEQINRDLTGMQITGAELINAPLTDGIILYMSNGDGKKYALEIGADPDAEADENPFYMAWGEATENQEDE